MEPLGAMQPWLKFTDLNKNTTQHVSFHSKYPLTGRTFVRSCSGRQIPPQIPLRCETQTSSKHNT